MKVICIHVYGVDKDIPLTVQVGGIYTVIKEGESLTGFKYYEFQHQPGIGYDRKCFVPLEQEPSAHVEDAVPYLIQSAKPYHYDTYSKRSINRPFQWNVPEKDRASVQALPRQPKPGNVDQRCHVQC